jgi:hypothetical protein
LSIDIKNNSLFKPFPWRNMNLYEKYIYIVNLADIKQDGGILIIVRRNKWLFVKTNNWIDKTTL